MGLYITVLSDDKHDASMKYSATIDRKGGSGSNAKGGIGGGLVLARKYSSGNLTGSGITDGGKEFLEVNLLELGDGVEHVDGSSVHVRLKSFTRVLKVVNKSSLLNKLVLLVDTNVFHLGLSVD